MERRKGVTWLAMSWPIVLISVLLAHALNAQQNPPRNFTRQFAALPDSAKVQYVLANHHALYTSSLDTAEIILTEAASIARRHQWKADEAFCNIYLGVVGFYRGDFDVALPKYLKAYDIFDSLNHYDGLARVCNEAAVLYSRNKNMPKAYEYLDKAESYAKQANNNASLGTALYHKAVYLEREGRQRESEKLYEQVYEIRTSMNDSIGLAHVLMDIANIAARRKDRTTALKHINRSTELFTLLGDRQGTAMSLVNTGELLFGLGEYRLAIEYFERCLEQARAIGFTDLVRHSYDQLASAHVKLNDYRSAFANQKQAQAYNDSLFTIERTKAISELTAKYETEKKEQQLALQQQQLEIKESQIRSTTALIAALIVILMLFILVFILYRERQRRSKALRDKEHELNLREASVRSSIESQELERRRFAQDLHDGMGQLISTLKLSLATSRNEHAQTDSRNQISLLDDMSDEIRRIAFNLMPHALVQHGLVAALEEMCHQLMRTTSIRVTVAAHDFPAGLGDLASTSLYRVIQEWINNVIKYNSATEISVQLIGHEDELSVMVEDNGAGFHPSVLENSKGNGWRNIRTRIDLLKGSVTVESEPGRKGSGLIVSIPLKNGKALAA